MKAYFALFCAVWMIYAPAVAFAIPSQRLFRRSVTTSGPVSPGTADLLAWWNLDNNGNDSSANARNTSTSGFPSYTTAKIGTHSLLIDATNEWLFINDADWMSPTGDFSVCGWYRPNDATPTSTVGVISHWGNNTNETSWVVRNWNSGGLNFTIAYGDGTTTKSVTTTGTLTDATWVFFTAVFKSSDSIKIYINGALNNTNSTDIPAAVRDPNGTAGDQNLRIGSYNAESTNSAIGRFDSMAIFNKALTADEITWLYNSGNGRAYSDL